MSKKTKIYKITEKLEEGFFGFWVKKYKVSFLVVFLLIISGIFSLLTIPKESSPDIKIGVIVVNTIYPGVNPDDIDSLITEKIENEITDLIGIKKITSVSEVGISTITIELSDGVDSGNLLNDIKDAVDKVNLPEDAEIPNIIELSSSNELMFEVLLYGDADKYSQFDLINYSRIIQKNLQGTNGIAGIDLGGADMKFGLPSSEDDYQIKVLLDKSKIEALGLSIRSIANIIKSYNKNTPIGNYTIGELNYDFRFEGELEDIEELKKVVIKGGAGSNVYLEDIAEFKNEYKTDDIKKLGFYKNSGYNYTSLVFNKAAGVDVFSVIEKAKIGLEDFIQKNPDLSDLKIFYIKDMSVFIIEDYQNLSQTAIQTIILVFLTILLFVGLRESIIASMLIPLAFLVTFSVLDAMGLSLNFLTNFSLVLTLGIAIDTVIVIVEGASEKIKLGYNRRSAVLLAVKDFKAPLIAGTMTTLVAFLPLMFLPGVMGRFLSYIPITIFITLVAALFLSLTISSALFITFIKKSNYFHKDEKLEATFSKSQREFLKEEREGKVEKKHEDTNIRERLLNSLGLKYYNTLKTVISSRLKRIIIIFIPILLMISTFIFLAPKIGFMMFPPTDNGIINGSIETKEGTDKKSLEKYLPIIDKALDKYPEIKVYNTSITGNKINLYIELINKEFRSKNNMRNVFDIEKLVDNDIRVLESEGLFIRLEAMKEGPPTGKPVGIKLIANNSKKVPELKRVAEEFKNYLRILPGSKNVSTSATETPGQFIFKFDRANLSYIGLTPDDILSEVYFYMNGIKAGSIKSEYEDNSIVLQIKEFENNLSPNELENLIIKTKVGDVRIGDFASYEFLKSVSSINRENGKISITVESDLEFGKLTSDLQPQLLEFARNYNYPDGVNFIEGGENETNKDLIISTIKSFFIALFLIFSILVFQFNSFKQPIIVLYSVILALLGVNVGLFLTGNSYSMTFAIGFIALTGVVVNDAIILIDIINKNLAKGIDDLHAVISAGKSRLQPIIVTTLTTVFGVLPLALQDEFWSGLGFTIVFGLLAGSAMTLFVIPSLYYEVVLRSNKK